MSFGGLGCVFWSSLGALWGPVAVQSGSLGGLGGYLQRRTVPWSLQGRFPGFSGWPFGTILVPFSAHFSIQNGDEHLIDLFVDLLLMLGLFLVQVWMLFWS